jgi:hypothetical protein
MNDPGPGAGCHDPGVGRAGCSIVDRLLRPDRVVDEPESMDLHMAVGDHTTEQMLIFQGAEEPLDHTVRLG